MVAGAAPAKPSHQTNPRFRGGWSFLVRVRVRVRARWSRRGQRRERCRVQSCEPGPDRDEAGRAGLAQVPPATLDQAEVVPDSNPSAKIPVSAQVR